MNKYNSMYVLFLFFYVFVIIFLPNENYINIIFSILFLFVFIYIFLKNKNKYFNFIFINLVFLIYIIFYNYININPDFKTNYLNKNLDNINFSVNSTDKEINQINEILNNKLDNNSIYEIYWIIKKNPNLDYSILNFDKNKVFLKLIDDILFFNEYNIKWTTIFYSEKSFKNYKILFKNYLINKYIYSKDLDWEIFKYNNNFFSIYLNKRFLYNQYIDEDVFNINYQNLVKIEKLIK